MKNIAIPFVVCLFTISIIANNNNSKEIKLPKKYKVLRSFSGEFTKNKSFHLISTIDRDLHKSVLLPFIHDGNSFKELKPLIFSEKNLSVISYHFKENILSLFVTYTKKDVSFLTKFDYNFLQKTFTHKDFYGHEDFLSSIRQKEKTIFIYKSKNNFRVLTFNGSQEPISQELIFNKDNNKIKFFFGSSNVNAVNTNEYVANGAISNIRVYYDNNQLFFTKDYKTDLVEKNIPEGLFGNESSITETFSISILDKQITPKFISFNTPSSVKLKKNSSFFLKGKLYKFNVSKKKASIRIFDYNTGLPLNTLEILENFTEFKTLTSDFIGIKKFLKNASKKDNFITITANETNNGKIIIRLDYLNQSYNYHHDWLFHHQFMMNQMQFQQQSIRAAGFGPFSNDFAFENAFVIEENKFFEILLNQEMNVINTQVNLPKTFYKKIGKKEILSDYNSELKYKHSSSCFFYDKFRFFTYNRKSKSFILISENI